ncbi:hypothetical protein PYCC9005_003479 [Savitreella phatthalungensis]
MLLKTAARHAAGCRRTLPMSIVRPFTRSLPKPAPSSISKMVFQTHRSDVDTRPLLRDPTLELPTSAVRDDPNAVKVYLDGEPHAFSTRWLRDSCRCGRCVDVSTRQKTFNTGDLAARPQIAAMRAVNGNALEIIWDHPADTTHRSIYPSTQLAATRTRAAAEQSRMNDVLPITWDAEQITALKHDGALTVRYGDLMRGDGAVWKLVEALTLCGLAFIEGCPSGGENSGVLETMVGRVGPLKNTFYGATWDVRSVADAKNVAYTSVDLDLHMDLLYYESPPGLQFLHCLANEVDGGASIFVDAFHAASILHARSPKAFHTLATHNVDFEYDNDNQFYHQSRPTFVLANTSTPTPEGTSPPLKYVNYSPPFQGTQVSEGFDEYAEAIREYASILREGSNRLELTLGKGTCVVFHNRRTLHARTAFSGAGERWLKGAYTDIDALHSKYRLLKRQSQ